MRVAVLDMGLGNLLSISRGIERASQGMFAGSSPNPGSGATGAEVIVAKCDTDADRADAVVIPGVGAFRDGARALMDRFGRTVERIRTGEIPALGVCLGMQLLFTRSFEGGEHPGLGIIRGDVVRLPPTVKVPHMGWNSVMLLRDCALTKGIQDGEYFYFVHSYYCRPDEGSATVAETEYGVQIPAIVAKGKVFGTQFHPEKSGEAGRMVIRNFLEAAGH
ncbi:MAG: imidazole glycerol phosphate synthase subunit HisH [Candidatus Methanosuratus sp.]|nr:imidazole glycerol phosphate synthase subunit HisH [Candidatus Methanosuratincola sp.]